MAVRLRLHRGSAASDVCGPEASQHTSGARGEHLLLKEVPLPACAGCPGVNKDKPASLSTPLAQLRSGQETQPMEEAS